MLIFLSILFDNLREPIKETNKYFTKIKTLKLKQFQSEFIVIKLVSFFFLFLMKPNVNKKTEFCEMQPIHLQELKNDGNRFVFLFNPFNNLCV